MVELFENKNQIEILTDSGWSKFNGMVKKPIRDVVTVVSDKGEITCTPDHKIYVDECNSVEAKNLKIGDTIVTKTGLGTVSLIVYREPMHVYDVLEVSAHNRFYANDVLVSNCKFLTADETLINAVTLLKLQGTDPIYKTNEIRWYDTVKPNKTYLIALDPSAGVGKDAAAIEVFCLPDMVQVAEWSHNRTSIPNQVRIMQNIINFISSEMRKTTGQMGDPDIYFTLENNSWGEAALQSINEIGEDRFQAIMMHEPRVRGVANRRKGLNTNTRSKALACSKMKSLLESEKLRVTSRLLVRQLKFFVSKGDSFAAKQGENDDCVMATLMCVRMMQMVTNWDETVGKLLRDDFGDEQHEDPMPISFGY